MGYGEIKKAVNSDLSKPLNTLIEEKTGVVNATGGTTTTGGIFAKLNKLLTDWTTARAGKIDTIDINVGSLVNGRVVKSVQRGITATPSGTQSSAATVVNISAINISKSIIMVEPFGFRDDYQNTVSYQWASSGTILNSSQIKLYSTLNAAINVVWQVIEFY